MGFFDNFKVSFGFGNHHERHERPRRHHHAHNPREQEMVEHGLGVFAWIERSGMFFNGDIPGVSGIMSVRMAESFDECLDKLTENINNSVSASFRSFRQDSSFEEICEEHPDAEIVFIPIYKK